MESQFGPVLERALAHALDHLEGLDTNPVNATVSPEKLMARLSRPLPVQGCDSATVIDELVSNVAGGLLGSAGGRFFGWVIGGSLPAALAADWLTSTWDQNAAAHACGPAEAIIEEVAGAWLKELLGLPASASFAFTTGSQLAHVTSLAAARHALLARRGWDVERDGLIGAPQIRILTSMDAHGSIGRALRLLGIGTAAIEHISSGPNGALTAEMLEWALTERPDDPAIVVLKAGDLNIGEFDDFKTLTPVAHDHGAWVHIDGAFGLWVATSEAHRHHLAGASDADSWVTDGHKWLNVPYDCGYAFIAHPEAHAASMSMLTSYVAQSDGWRGQLDWNPEWSRRGRGVATYAAIRELGREGIGALVDRCCRYAREIVLGIGALPGAEIVALPTINQGLLRFLEPTVAATEADHDRRTDAVIAAINATGEAFFTGTTWHGMRCMRVSVVNWQTGPRDVERAVEAARLVLTS